MAGRVVQEREWRLSCLWSARRRSDGRLSHARTRCQAACGFMSCPGPRVSALAAGARRRWPSCSRVPGAAGTSCATADTAHGAWLLLAGVACRPGLGASPGGPFSLPLYCLQPLHSFILVVVDGLQASNSSCLCCDLLALTLWSFVRCRPDARALTVAWSLRCREAMAYSRQDIEITPDEWAKILGAQPEPVRGRGPPPNKKKKQKKKEKKEGKNIGEKK